MCLFCFCFVFPNTSDICNGKKKKENKKKKKKDIFFEPLCCRLPSRKRIMGDLSLTALEEPSGRKGCFIKYYFLLSSRETTHNLW